MHFVSEPRSTELLECLGDRTLLALKPPTWIQIPGPPSVVPFLGYCYHSGEALILDFDRVLRVYPDYSPTYQRHSFPAEYDPRNLYCTTNESTRSSVRYLNQKKRRAGAR